MSIATEISTVIDSITSFANDVMDRFDSGLIHLLAWLSAKIIKYLILSKIYFTVYTIGFAWATAKILLNDIGVIPAINYALSFLPPDVAYMMDVMGFNQAINIIVTALVARFVLRFMPGYK